MGIRRCSPFFILGGAAVAAWGTVPNVPAKGFSGETPLEPARRSGAEGRLEPALLRTEATLAAVLDATGDAVCVVDNVFAGSGRNRIIAARILARSTFYYKMNRPGLWGGKQNPD